MTMKRLDYIDVLKGLAILCITFLHFEEGVIPGWLNSWIGNFMITAFYFSSGWLMGLQNKEVSVKDLAKKRLRSLGIPYLYFTFIILIFDVVWYLCGNYDLKFLLTELYKAVTLRGIGTLWFLPSLFFGELIFVWIRKKDCLSWLLLTVFTLYYLHYYWIWDSAYRNLSALNMVIDAPFRTIRNVFIAWPVIFMGYHIAKLFRVDLTKNKIRYGCMGVVITALSVCTNGFGLFGFGDVSPFMGTVIGPLGLTLMFLPVGSSKLLNPITYWGKNSLILMVVHYSITYVLCQYVCEHWLMRPLYGWISIGFFFLAVLTTYPIVTLINDRFPFLLGRKS